MAERMLIVKVKRVDQAGKCELYGRHHRYPDLKCDLADLQVVLSDALALPVGEERPLSAWAVYELSSKLNSENHPYKDLVLLEPLNAPATVTSAAVGNPDVLAELRAIRAVLTALATAQGVTVPAAAAAAGDGDPDLEDIFPRFEGGLPVPDNAIGFYKEFVKVLERRPKDIDELRVWALGQQRRRRQAP